MSVFVKDHALPYLRSGGKQRTFLWITEISMLIEANAFVRLGTSEKT